MAKPLHLALGACIIQKDYGFSDVEITFQIQENPYMQFFCGFAQYKDEIPFDPSLMVYFRKRLTPEILGEINELIITKAQCNNNDDNGLQPPQNNGTLIVDATAPYPQIYCSRGWLTVCFSEVIVLMKVRQTNYSFYCSSLCMRWSKSYLADMILLTKNYSKGSS